MTRTPSPSPQLTTATATAEAKLAITFDDVDGIWCAAGAPVDAYDDRTLPPMEQRPLRNEYSERGVRFFGPTATTGAVVVLPVCSEEDVGATSGSHALELNDGNVAAPPETIKTSRLYGSVSFYFWAAPSVRLAVHAFRGDVPVSSTFSRPGEWGYLGFVLTAEGRGFDRVVLDLAEGDTSEWDQLPTCPGPSPDAACRTTDRAPGAGYAVLDDLSFWPIGVRPTLAPLPPEVGPVSR